jgi:hypothetical protein
MSTLKVKDSLGLPVKGWRFQRTWFTGDKATSKVWGWLLIAPDGYRRFNPGNWQQFVPFARLVISNHGYTTTLS